MGQIFGCVFRALIGKSSQFCSKMQIELVELFNTEQRISLWLCFKEGLSVLWFKKKGWGFCKGMGLLGLFCWPYNY